MMSSKPKRIKFGVSDENLSIPAPAKKYVPEWYKKSPRFIGNNGQPRIASNQDNGNKGLKTCVPFLDSLTNGYMAELWQDVQITQTPEGPRIEWPLSPSVMQARNGVGLELIPVPAGHIDTQFVWLNPYIIETPPGYSVLITHPLNRNDLPFTTLSGIMDADVIMGPGHLPFYLKEGFEGVIPAGTPIFQIIPIKRDDWVSELDDSLSSRSDKRMWESLRRIYGDYKNRLWTKKNFN